MSEWKEQETHSPRVPIQAEPSTNSHDEGFDDDGDFDGDEMEDGFGGNGSGGGNVFSSNYQSPKYAHGFDAEYTAGNSFGSPHASFNRHSDGTTAHPHVGIREVQYPLSIDYKPTPIDYTHEVVRRRAVLNVPDAGFEGVSDACAKLSNYSCSCTDCERKLHMESLAVESSPQAVYTPSLQLQRYAETDQCADPFYYYAHCGNEQIQTLCSALHDLSTSLESLEPKSFHRQSA